MPNNSLLDYRGLPPFDKLQISEIEPAVTAAVKRVTDELAKLEAKPNLSWEEVAERQDAWDLLLSRMWGPVTHLLGVKNSPELRAAFEKLQPHIVDLGLRLSQSGPLYRAFKQAQENRSLFMALPHGAKRIIEKNIQEAEHAGIALDGAKRERFKAIKQARSKLSTQFSNNVLDSVKAFDMVLTDTEEVAGLQKHFLELSAQTYNQRKNVTTATAESGPWMITLDMPSYSGFMRFSTRRDLREKLYRAEISRASAAPHDNAPIINEILQLRREEANLLGQKTFADLSLSEKMAGDVTSARELLEKLLATAMPAARREHADLEAFAKKHGCNDTLWEWDVPFWAERLQEQMLQFSEDELLPYFPLTKVLDGLWALVKTLFDVTVKAADGEAPVWHPDVRFFKIFSAQNKQVAAFYLDPFTRSAEKRGGAWMDNCVDRRRHGSELDLPVAYLVCNSTPPVGDKPSLLSFSQVRTLFHEFGHGLQHMLTTVDDAAVAGIRNIEWDAVELASQFMENWLFHPPILKSLTAHIETGASLPDRYIEKLMLMRTFRQGAATIRQVQFALTDLFLHHDFDPYGRTDVFTAYANIVARTSVLPPRPENRFLCAFSHIFAGGYSAGYYSYKWAEVLSADAFSAFEEAGLENLSKRREIGARYRDTILALGGSRHPMDVFKMFRGRTPSTDPLLKHAGML